MENKEEKYTVAFTMDFETGGFDCQNSACTQIAVHAVRIDTFETIARFVRYIKPYHKKIDKGGKQRKILVPKLDIEEAENEYLEYNESAAKVSGITFDMLEEKGDSIEIVARDLVQFIKDYRTGVGKRCKSFFIGQNITFDLGFLQHLFEYGGQIKEYENLLRGNNDFYGNYMPMYVDTLALGYLAFGNKPEIQSFNLSNLIDMFGLELNDAHDADADVTATTNVCMSCTQRMRSEDGDTSNALVVTKKEKTRNHFKI